MESMVKDKGFVSEDVYQNLDTLRLQSRAEEAVETLNEYLNQEYGSGVSAALLTRSGHYGMSLMSDSILMEDRYGEGEIEAQEVADIDICILLEEGADAEEARYQFKQENGKEGAINQMFPDVEINPRILYANDFQGKMNKAAEEWQKDRIQESIRFPATNGDETMRQPAKFLGYFHQGYTPVVSNSEVESAIKDSVSSILNGDGEVAPEIREDVWGDFESRMDYKPRAMKKNHDMGVNELAKRNSERIDFEGYEGRGSLDGLVEELKIQIMDETDLSGRIQGDFRDPFNFESDLDQDQSRLNGTGVEPEADPEAELVRRASRRFIKNHPDMNRRNTGGDYGYVFGSSRLTDYFGKEDPFLKMAEDAAKRHLGTQRASNDEEPDIDDSQSTFDYFG